eukprot:gene12028-7345_t
MSEGKGTGAGPATAGGSTKGNSISGGAAGEKVVKIAGTGTVTLPSRKSLVPKVERLSEEKEELKRAARVVPWPKRGGVLKFRTSFTNTVLDVMTEKGWERTQDDLEITPHNWDIFWAEVGWVSSSPAAAYGHDGARVCHFPNHYELTRKDCGVTNMKRLKKRLEKEHGKEKVKGELGCDFYPPTFILPSFDLRIYVLVTSYRPLRAWLYREGFARFSGSLFSMDKKDIANNFIHLTNVAIQKTADGYDKGKGCKWLFSRVKAYLASRFGDDAVRGCLQAINTVITRSLESVQHVMINDSHCFELYGYDILLDDALKPWLIEVNASPSVSADTKDDYTLKKGLLEDTFGIVEMGLLGKEQDFSRVGGFDLLWNDGPIDPHAGNPEEVLEGTRLPISRLGGWMGDREANLNQVMDQCRREAKVKL